MCQAWSRQGWEEAHGAGEENPKYKYKQIEIQNTNASKQKFKMQNKPIENTKYMKKSTKGAKVSPECTQDIFALLFCKNLDWVYILSCVHLKCCIVSWALHCKCIVSATEKATHTVSIVCATVYCMSLSLFICKLYICTLYICIML